MTADQMMLFGLLAGVFIFLIWGKIRYDLVAFGALILALILGLVPKEEAFSGFGHPATIIIALVLIVSKGLANSGAIDLIARYVVQTGRSLSTHISIIATVAAGLSAMMNNVAALALLMPIDIKAAQNAKRSPSLSLMPLSFASILGGLVTLIGTPPNIIIASYREKEMGTAFGMFDFAPVGLACAVAGVLFIALIGWRLIPVPKNNTDGDAEMFQIQDYIAEIRVPEKSPIIGKQVRQLDTDVEKHDTAIIGLVRNGNRMPGQARLVIIEQGDILIVEANAESIDAVVGDLKLEYVSNKTGESFLGKDLSLVEVVVPEGALIEGRSAMSLRLLHNHGITLLGVSRRGKRFYERVRKLRTQTGDVLLLLGPTHQLPNIVKWLGVLPLKERDLQVVQRDKALISVAIFAAAIALSSMGLLYLPIALAAVVVFYVLFNIVPARNVYTSVEWPVIVLLGSMLPIGAALESSGGTTLIANQLVTYAADYGPVVVLTLLMIVTMTLSDVLNNTATAVIAAPIAMKVAETMKVSPDPFLMAVAVAASCAFLTPIGHKNNTLIMGPGGYKFGDYWRMGLPLEILVIAVAIPMILFVWPFYPA